MNSNIRNKTKISLRQKIALILFGLFLSVLLLEIGLRVGGLVILSLQEYRNRVSLREKDTCRIMCLGESTTAAIVPHAYPAQLEQILNERDTGIKFSVINKGIAAVNTSVIISQLETNLDKCNPDIVIAMIGINDIKTDMVPYGEDHKSNTIIALKCSRVYKLTRLLWLHMLARFRKIGLFVSVKKDNATDRFKKKLEGEYLIEKERLLKEILEFDPNDDSAYRKLGCLYFDQQRFNEAEQALKKGLTISPEYFNLWRGLGRVCLKRGKFNEAEQALEKALEFYPKDVIAHEVLSLVYQKEGRLEESEKALEKILEINSGDAIAYETLSLFYNNKEKSNESKLDSKDDHIYRLLARLYSNDELSRVYAEKSKVLSKKYYNPMTVKNYYALKQMLDKRNIQLVSVQYPVRDIVPLKRMFIWQAKGDIIFVDNEKVFKDAIRELGYDEYFMNAFGGDFGHCTEKGNRLLAENIANVILKEYFDK